jgi:hypothetical protein
VYKVSGFRGDRHIAMADWETWGHLEVVVQEATEVDAVYQTYHNRPRIDDPVPMMARLHMEEMRRQADQARLAQDVADDRPVVGPHLRLIALRIWQVLHVRVRSHGLERNMGTAPDQA